jgi:membrane-associated protease RseP (regulator of RpoE activity)
MQTETPPPPAPPAAIQRDAPGEGPMTASQWLRLGMLLAFFVFLYVTTGVWGLVIVAGLVTLITFHELGHYLSAKRSGMKVTEFFVGFGPRIWSIKRGETEYGLKAIPAGAYVRIIGMHNLEEVDPADEGRTYRQKPFKARLLTVLAGVAMNFLLAIILIYVTLVGFGRPGGVIATKPDASKWHVDHTIADSGARAAGIREGETIVAIDGRKISSFDQVKDAVTSRAGDTVPVELVSGNSRRTVDVKLGSKDGKGDCQIDAGGPGPGCLGVSAATRPVERVGPVAAIPQTFHEFGTITVGSMQALGRFFSPSGLSNFADLVARNGEPATTVDNATNAGASTQSSGQDEERLISLFGIVRIGADIGASGWSSILVLFISINIFLGVVNLVPLLPFDGGHAVIATYEKIQEMRQRRQTRYFTDVTKLLPLTYAVVLLLGLIFITTSYLDLVNPPKL